MKQGLPTSGRNNQKQNCPRLVHKREPQQDERYTKKGRPRVRGHSDGMAQVPPPLSAQRRGPQSPNSLLWIRPQAAPRSATCNLAWKQTTQARPHVSVQLGRHRCSEYWYSHVVWHPQRSRPLVGRPRPWTLCTLVPACSVQGGLGVAEPPAPCTTRPCRCPRQLRGRSGAPAPRPACPGCGRP
jgi:hypothetical protein